jgi:hypothetical protein
MLRKQRSKKAAIECFYFGFEKSSKETIFVCEFVKAGWLPAKTP